MNITNTEIAQASIEIFCGLTFIMAAIIIITYKLKSENRKIFINVFTGAALLFFSEALTYIFRGNTDTLSIVMSRSCNFAAFVINLLLIYLFIRYVYGILREDGYQAPKMYQITVNVFLGIAATILIINIFTGWMYYFDDANYYHRGNMWYIYTGASLLAIFTGGIMGIVNRKIITRLRLLSVILFTVIPAMSVLMQSFYYDLPILSIGIALSIWILFGMYLISMMKDGDDEKEDNDRRRTYITIIILIISMILIMSTSIVSCIVSINRMSNESSEEDSQIIAHLINDGIQNKFIRPITVAETMSKDYSLVRAMKASTPGNAERVEVILSKYLESIRTGFDYQMVFAVSDKSGAYYTYNGISKYIHPETDSHDIWYQYFLDSGHAYDLDVDTDEANNWSLSVFVNCEVRDDDDSLLGVCGVAVEMNELCDYFSKLEKKYNVKINLADETGLIQVDSNPKRIEKDKVDNSYFNKINSKEFYYERMSDSSRMTKYMKDLDWYLVIEDTKPTKINVMSIILPIMFIFIAGLIMMTVVFGIITFREKKIRDELIEKKALSVTDKLTGLKNRRAYEEMRLNIQTNRLESKYSIVMMDMNGLKRINDEMGHNTGDELIIIAANCMNTVFSKYGTIYRIGGDEFVALLECSEEILKDAIDTFDHMMENARDTAGNIASVSKGIVPASESECMSFDEMMQKADKLMYEDKNRHYKTSGEIRRL